MKFAKVGSKNCEMFEIPGFTECGFQAAGPPTKWPVHRVCDLINQLFERGRDPVSRAEGSRTTHTHSPACSHTLNITRVQGKQPLQPTISRGSVFCPCHEVLWTHLFIASVLSPTSKSLTALTIKCNERGRFMEPGPEGAEASARPAAFTPSHLLISSAAFAGPALLRDGVRERRRSHVPHPEVQEVRRAQGTILHRGDHLGSHVPAQQRHHLQV